MRKLLMLIFMFSGLALAVNAQQKTVTGTVTGSDDGLPIIGATVQIKGSVTGVATDLDGKYSIAVPEGSVLVIRYVGMKTKEITVGAGNVYDVVLDADYLGVDEVVVVGYGTRMKSELSGSIAQVRASDIANTTQPSFESALQGKAAGVYVQGGSGKLGQAIKVRVRGSASISADNQPLYVVDGIPINTQNIGTGGNEPTNPMADLNPADIENIQILKDASASAIYGARAANGVILITTKRGKEGKTAFNFTAQAGFSEPANKVGFLNRAQYLALVEEGFNNVVDLYG
ncbi:MAG: TonB-dependent receptor plug domain-containing protein, partial [Bacteroidales bacterium]|nr:TonB-dependent receptor plug domain-containing protein [Bacteroidales bacterium]